MNNEEEGHIRKWLDQLRAGAITNTTFVDNVETVFISRRLYNELHDKHMLSLKVKR